MGVALWQPQSNVLIIKGESLGRGMSAALHPLLKDLFTEAQVTPQALEGIVVNRGPGSFTSIRLGLAAAQGLSLPWGIPIYGLDAFSQLVAPFKAIGQPITAWIKAKEYEVYVQTFAPGGEVASDMCCMTLDEAQAALQPSWLIGSGVPLGQDWPAGIMVPDHPHARLPDMAWTVQQGPRLKAQGATDLTPYYIKPLNYRTLADVS